MGRAGVLCTQSVSLTAGTGPAEVLFFYSSLLQLTLNPSFLREYPGQEARRRNVPCSEQSTAAPSAPRTTACLSPARSDPPARVKCPVPTGHWGR